MEWWDTVENKFYLLKLWKGVEMTRAMGYQQLNHLHVLYIQYQCRASKNRFSKPLLEHQMF